jgi:hypothetical protein
MTDRSRADLLLSFMRRRGIDLLSLIVEHLNRGTPHRRIAAMVAMDEAQFSRFIHATLVQTWTVAPDISDVIELYRQLEARNAQRLRGDAPAVAERARHAV